MIRSSSTSTRTCIASALHDTFWCKAPAWGPQLYVQLNRMPSLWEGQLVAHVQHQALPWLRELLQAIRLRRCLRAVPLLLY